MTAPMLIDTGSVLLAPGFDLTLRPMRYPEFYEMYKAAIRNTWTVDQVDFSIDVNDLTRKMSAAERSKLLHWRVIDQRPYVVQAAVRVGLGGVDEVVKTAVARSRFRKICHSARRVSA